MATTMFIGSGRRSGTRGGQDQFTWETVKNDKYKEFYLGHSLHTMEKPTFNNRKPNPLWWNKDGKTGAQQAAGEQDEIAKIKEQEEQLMREALGLAPRRKLQSGKGLDSGEMKELTKRGNTERDGILETDRVAGLGYAPHIVHPGQEGNRLKNMMNGQEGGELPPQTPSHITPRTPAPHHGLQEEDNDEEWVEAKPAKSSKKEKHHGRDKKDKKKSKKKKKEHHKEKKEERRKRKREDKEGEEEGKRDRDRDHKKDKRKEKDRDEHRERDRERRKEGHRDRERERERDKDRDRERERGRDRDRDRERGRGREDDNEDSHRHKRRRHSESP